MGAALGTLCSVYFAVALLMPMAVVLVPIQLLKLVPGLSRARRAGYSLMLLQAAWRFSLRVTPWVRFRPDARFAENVRAFGEDVVARGEHQDGARSVMILGNHTSFMDSMLIATEIPAGAAYYSRTYMSEKLFSLPLLGTICAACDQFSVDFGGKQGFKVNKEKMEKTDALVDKHLEAGGLLSFFPEGEINKNPSEIMLVRYGGMKKALAFDAKLYIFLSEGCPQMWPRKTPVGGRPSTIKYSVRCLAPNGARALASELLANSENKSKPGHVLLAEHVRAEMQASLDVLLGLEKKEL
jgi:1-acyl-sn-glycerol-3-phosphate acyltransferase